MVVKGSGFVTLDEAAVAMLCGGRVGRQVVPVGHTRLADGIARALAGTISASEMDRLMEECRIVAPGNSPRRVRTGWWPNAEALHEAWKHRTPNDYISAGGRSILVLYGSEDTVTPVPNVHALTDELSDQVRPVEITGAGHCMQMERPREVEAAILGWLTDHRSVSMAVSLVVRIAGAGRQSVVGRRPAKQLSRLLDVPFATPATMPVRSAEPHMSSPTSARILMSQ
jgi:hypothetical protein